MPGVHPDRELSRSCPSSGCLAALAIPRFIEVDSSASRQAARVIGCGTQSTRKPHLVANQAFTDRMDRRCRGVFTGGDPFGAELQLVPLRPRIGGGGLHFQAAGAPTGAPALAAHECRPVEGKIAASRSSTVGTILMPSEHAAELAESVSNMFRPCPVNQARR
ncbi:MAG: hypothetical protein MZV70_03670 [Desulfobacterales bacterium]|nr:hypothetical protein [Desulfobacterales bacterium]